MGFPIMKIRSESLFNQLKSEKFGKSIYSFEEVGSTNEIAHELAINGAPEGTVVISDSQTIGKGRLDRKWISPPGKNIYISIIFRPDIEAIDAPFLTLVSSIALAETIRNEGTDAFIKWPNDTGMPLRYENPREVGADRIVNAVAAYELYGGPIISVDFGTATTFDCVSEQGEYLGGVICPGIHISMEALFERASKLHRVEIARPKSVIGKTTRWTRVKKVLRQKKAKAGSSGAASKSGP